MKEKGYLIDKTGKSSGKRIAGFILIAGLLLIGGYGIYRNSSVAAQIMWPIAAVAAACFGMTVFEKKA